MTAEIKFSMPVSALDALRRIMRRDYKQDCTDKILAFEMPESHPKRVEVLRGCLRHENERDLLERVLGIDSAKDEIGETIPDDPK